jgi:dimethylhistidine N-methyltransferase
MLKNPAEMAKSQPRLGFVWQDEDAAFRDAVIEGLSRADKAIPPRFLYDARGSALFERICGLPEYYLTRTETAILRDHASDIANLVGESAFLVELGSGASVKTRIILDALHKPASYAPIDVSRTMLKMAASSIAVDYPRLRITAVCADYGAEFPLPDIGSRRVAFFPGSTIGNLDSDSAVALLRRWRRKLGRNGLMIIGADLKKDRRIIEAAYRDPGGVTKNFIKNILARANRELDADFDLSKFLYEARYDPSEGRVDMLLRSAERQTASVAGQFFDFMPGEAIHIESSHKYSPADLDELAPMSGFSLLARFTDEKSWFSVEVWSGA